jgi:hypothetical protein
MAEFTACEDCDFVAEHTRKYSPRQWLCLRFPRLENLDAVAPKQWVLHEPYNRCVNINLGHCPCFVKRRNGQKELPVGSAGHKATEAA